MPSSIQIGNTGSGKSEAMKLFLEMLRRLMIAASLCYDPKGPLAREMFAHHVAKGSERRVIFHEFSSDFVLGLDLWEWSMERGMKKENQDGLIRNELAQVLTGMQETVPLRSQPQKLQYFELACDACRYMPYPVPIDWLYDALDPESDNFKRIVRDNTNPETVRQLRSLAAKCATNPLKFAELVDPTRRLLKPLKHPIIVAMANAPKKLDLRQTLKDKVQILFSGAGLDDDTNRLLCLLLQRRVFAICKDAADAGSPLPTEVILEEAESTRTVADLTINAMKTLRYARCFVHVLGQGVAGFGDKFNPLAANAPVKIAYRLDSADVDVMAKIFLNATFDPLAVHYTRDREIRDGWESVTTHSTTKNISEQHAKGQSKHKNTGHSDTVSESERARYKIQTDAFYKSDRIQEMEIKSRLVNLKPGQRGVRDMDGVRFETLTLIGDAWACSTDPRTGLKSRLYLNRLAQAWQRMTSRPYFTPADLCSPTPSPSSSAPTPDPTTLATLWDVPAPPSSPTSRRRGRSGRNSS